MKLNKHDREAFVRAVMQDVPKTDYNKLVQEAVTLWERSILPKKFVEALDDPETQKYIPRHRTVYIPGPFNNPYTWGSYSRSELPQALQDVCEQYTEEIRAQTNAHDALKDKLTAAIAACSTLKQAKERLPEFEKYLPTDRDNTGTSNLPAIANLVADLVQLGWPKDKEAQA